MEEKAPDKALNIGKVSATGSFHLFGGQMASTVILAIGTIVIGWLILQSDYGLYAVAMIPTTTLLLFHEWGIGPAIIRHCAKSRMTNNVQALRQTIISGLVFELSTGLLLTLIAVITSSYVATNLFSKPDSGFLIVLISITILPTALYSVVQSVFVGFENMKLIAVTSTLQAIAQSVVAPLLVFLGYGVYGAIVGYVLGSLVASVSSLFLLYFIILRKLDKVKITLQDISVNLRGLLKYGIPLAIGTLLGGLLAQFYSLMIATYVSDLALIGNYKIATNFTVLLTFFSSPISTVLFPAFSKLDLKKDFDIIKSVFASSVKYAGLLLVPSTMLLAVLSGSIIGSLYGDKWPFAPQFLVLIIVVYLYPAIGQLSVSGLLRAGGETQFLMKMNLLNLLIGAPAAFFVAPVFGLGGVLAVYLLAGFPSLIGCLYWVWRKYRAQFDYGSTVRIFISSSVAALVVYLLLNSLVISSWFKLGIGFALFVGIYLVSAPLIGAVNSSDIGYLRVMFSGFGVVAKIMNIPLSIMDRVLKKKDSFSKKA